MFKLIQQHTQAFQLFYCPPLAGSTPVLAWCKPQVVPVFAKDTAPDLTDAAFNDWVHCLQNTATSSLDSEHAQHILQYWSCWQISRFNQYRPAKSLPSCYVLLLLDTDASTSELAELLKHAQVFALTQQATLLIADDANGGHSQCWQRLASLGLPQGAGNNVRERDGPVTQVISEPCHHASLLANAQAVFTVRSWLGFEALLWQKPVYCLGGAFYARLGLTNDLTLSPYQTTLSLHQLVRKVLVEGVISRLPHNAYEQPDSVSAFEWLALQVAQRHRYAAEIYAIGFNLLWRKPARQFFQGSRLHFVSRPSEVPSGATALRWGFKPLNGLDPTVKLIRVEDGFLRSVGLGALFAQPLSWVADSQGLYFDATVPSDLEQLLAQQAFSPVLLLLAEQLISKLQHSGISKYNTGADYWQRPEGVNKVILVPGQVETDASIARGAPGIRHNIALLQSVRDANPDAFIVYKPHPDVLAGARAAGLDEQQALKYCDEQLLDVSMGQLLTQVDEVHVLTSLAGFEALIRGCKVYCYGMPFYAGWGLTFDKHQCERRGVRLTLPQLVAASLMVYPLYLCRHTGYYATAEQTLDDLVRWREQKNGKSSWQTPVLKILRWGISLIGGKK